MRGQRERWVLIHLERDQRAKITYLGARLSSHRKGTELGEGCLPRSQAPAMAHISVPLSVSMGPRRPPGYCKCTEYYPRKP